MKTRAGEPTAKLLPVKCKHLRNWESGRVDREAAKTPGSKENLSRFTFTSPLHLCISACLHICTLHFCLFSPQVYPDLRMFALIKPAVFQTQMLALRISQDIQIMIE
jgi:hypothetical protein